MSRIILTYTSYQLKNGRWIPEATERNYLPDKVEERKYAWDEVFDSKEEADEFAKMKMQQK